MFDGTVEQMGQRLQLFAQAESIIGLTGSALTSKELSCVQSQFNTTPIKFPTIAEVDFDKQVHLKDGLTTTTLKDFVQVISKIVKH